MADPDRVSDPGESSDPEGQQALPTGTFMLDDKITVVSGATFEGGEEVLDGNAYYKCKFKNVSLVFEGRDTFLFHDCNFDDVLFRIRENSTTVMAGLAYLKRIGFEDVVSRVLDFSLNTPYANGLDNE